MQRLKWHFSLRNIQVSNAGRGGEKLDKAPHLCVKLVAGKERWMEREGKDEEVGKKRER